MGYFYGPCLRTRYLYHDAEEQQGVPVEDGQGKKEGKDCHANDIKENGVNDGLSDDVGILHSHDNDSHERESEVGAARLA
jgi:hypothetical protein